MNVRLPLAGLAAALAFALAVAGCGNGEPGPGTGAGLVPAAPSTGPAARAPRKPRNLIELVVDGHSYRADVASSFGHTFLQEPAGPRYHLEMSSAWLEGQEMSMVKLTLLNVDPQGRTFPLQATDPQGPALVLTELPGWKGKRWRSTAGSLELEFDIADPRAQPVTRATGRFGATLRELDPHGDDFADGGRQLTVSGHFDFNRDRL